MRRQLALVTVLCLILAWSPAGVLANPSKDRWWFGASAGYHTTEASITPNADESGDIRPDDYVSRDAAVDDTISYGLSAGFGMTERFTLQLDVGYFEGEIDGIDTYMVDTFPRVAPSNLNVFLLPRETTESMTTGTLTEIPVSLSGVVRFMKDGPFNPYVGAGAGMVFTQIDAVGDIEALNARMGAMRIRAILDEKGHDVTPKEFFPLKGPARVPAFPMEVEVDDGVEFHLMTGLEYFPTEHLSIIADLRYSFVDQEVRIEMGGEDQVVLDIWSEEIFRDDGSVQYFRDNGGVPNPYRNNDPNQGTVNCSRNTTGDFDRDGHNDDYCYQGNTGTPLGDFLVQGGEINLSGFTLTLGMRFYLP